MRKYYYLSCILLSSYAFSQVGINTPTPQGTLDVNGNIMVRLTPTHAPAASYNVLAVNPTNREVQIISTTLQSAVNGSIVKVEKDTNVNLANVAIFAGSGYNRINFSQANVKIDNPDPNANFDVTDDSYTAKSTGIYEVNYEFRYGSGVQASILGGVPGIGVFKKVGSAAATLLDERLFSGANLLVANITISQTSINSIYKLTAGDKLLFGVNEGSIVVSLLSGSFVTINIRKISD
ncbi:hypothetical protein [Halpernia frigidisoli]|uniref:C1q domain-containing protein n=1 Tax=Halpernia frigidisoli TaxID=1125876 RepID=A0A1I3DKT1_9FLAO|nr:hypothetical protein [Halpernia frigidisoli]SFH87325.1 hypothetical protein SAMN05443292_0547 [Halpernia frigidisoli]